VSSGVDDNSTGASSSNLPTLLPTLAQASVFAASGEETFVESTLDDNILPSFTLACAPDFKWGDVPGDTFLHSVTCCYDEVVHWKKFLFKIPSAKCGRAFVAEQARLFHAYGTSSALESVALKAAMIMPVLLLQRPHIKSKNKDHICHLNRRLALWKQGDINGLVLEGRTLQSLFSNSKVIRNNDDKSIARKFSNLRLNGKVKDALRLLSSESQGSVLPLNSTVRCLLNDKHPKKQPAHLNTLIDSPPGDLPHPIMFDQIDAIRVRRIALKLHGAAGPSGLDASAWKHMCTSFQVVSDDLCHALSLVSKRLCTEFVDPATLSSFVLVVLLL